MRINHEDKVFIKKYFPDLTLDLNKNILSGKLKFIASYNKKKRRYCIYSSHSININKYLIKDFYKIEIDLSPNKNIYREVKETGGKIKEVAKLKNLNICDLHFYSDSIKNNDLKNKVCLIGYFDENQSINLKEFICEFVIPFFYDQSFFSKYDKWPRGFYAHGCLGILENYYDRINKIRLKESITRKCVIFLNQLKTNKQDEIGFRNVKNLLNKKKIKSYWNCIGRGCSNYQKLRKIGKRYHRKPRLSNFQLCHPRALHGLRLLQKNIKKYKLKNKLEN